jgi:hypothetical protein
MSTDNRIYEADAYALSELRLQTRVAKDVQLALELQAMSGSEDVQLKSENHSFSRETILRLVDWLKEE